MGTQQQWNKVKVDPPVLETLHLEKRSYSAHARIRECDTWHNVLQLHLPMLVEWVYMDWNMLEEVCRYGKCKVCLE